MTPALDDLDSMLTAPGQMFEIGEAQVNGIRVPVWKNAPASLAAVVESSRQFGDREFLVFGPERLSFADHYRRVASLAHHLVDDYGIRKGERIAIAMRNYPEWSVAFWATVCVGAVAVPLNAWWTADELRYGLADAGAVLLIADEERAQRIAGSDSGLAPRGTIVARPKAPTEGMRDFADLLHKTNGCVLPPITIQPEDHATIFYTSGTTGKPKGALGTHRNMCSNVTSLAFVKVRGVLRAGGSMEDLVRARQRSESYLLSVPFFHVTGCHGILLGMLAFGGKIVLLHKWDAEHALQLIEQEHVSTFGGVPTMAWQLLEAMQSTTHDYSSIQNIAYGGAPAAPELLRRIRATLPLCQPSNGYGLTECSSMVTLNSGPDYLAKPDSAGVPVPVCRVIAVNPAGQEVPAGEPGELWISGPNVVCGYWNKPEATASAFTDGWFHSGDVGWLDDEGSVYIVDRIKDMIIRGGENIYCAEVENALLEHPAVHGAAVFGIPHQVLGEEVGCVVQVEESAPVAEAELRAHLGRRLALFKAPSHYWFRTEPLPLGATGKVLKRELRAQLLNLP